jgi:hypothetical protein
MEDAKQIALRALTGAFIDRDPSVVERYFAPTTSSIIRPFLMDRGPFPVSSPA